MIILYLFSAILLLLFVVGLSGVELFNISLDAQPGHLVGLVYLSVPYLYSIESSKGQVSNEDAA